MASRYLLLLLILGLSCVGVRSLKCYQCTSIVSDRRCDDPKSNSIVPTECPPTATHCSKWYVTGLYMNRGCMVGCDENDVGGSVSDRKCCNTDGCNNSSNKHMPSIYLLAFSTIIVAYYGLGK